MSFAAIAGGIGALLGGASAAGSAVAGGKMNRKNRRWQEKMYKQQLQDQRENSRMQWQESRDYAKWAYDNIESPAAQRAGFKAAGINPFVEGSVLQPMGASSGNASAPEGATPPSSGPYQFNPGSAIQQGASALREYAMQSVQAKNIEAQTEYTNAQRLKTLAETKGIENMNSAFEFVRSALESDALSKKFEARLKGVEAKYAEIKAIQDSAEREARISELWSREEKNLAEAAKTDADRLTVDTLRDGMKRLQDANIENVNAQTQTEGAKQANLGADSDLKRAQKQTEDALRSGRVKFTDEQAKGIISSTFGQEIANMREADALARVLTGTDRSSSLWGLVDKLIEAKTRDEPGTFSQELRDRYYRDILSRLK